MYPFAELISRIIVSKNSKFDLSSLDKYELNAQVIVK
jgi:hypothetical protein